MSDLISLCRLERENTGLRERLLDLASMLDKIKLVEYMEKNNVSSFVLGKYILTFCSFRSWSLDSWVRTRSPVTIVLETWTRTTTPARKTGKEYQVLVLVIQYM